jgi:hypothetical protein
VLTVRRPIHLTPSMGRGLWLEPRNRRTQVGAGAVGRS